MKPLIRIFPAALLILMSFVWMSAAQAIPAFGTQINKDCSYCHSAWPQLNKKGRSFKELGYRLPADADAGSKYSLLDRESFPVSAMIIARPYYQSGASQTVKMRALHEVELFVAGPIADKWSGYFEMEMEDEVKTQAGGAAIDAFNWILLPAAHTTYHSSKMVNVQIAWAPVNWADPYDTFADARRLTRKPDDVTKKLGGARQMVTVYGRANQLFYNVGYVGAPGDAEPTVFQTTARVAFDVNDKVMVGGLYVSDPVESITALDVQAEVAGFNVNASHLPRTAGAITHLQGMLIMKEGKRPGWVPVLRYENNPAGNSTTVNITRYLAENAKVWLEYRSNDASANVTTVQAYIAF